MVKLVLKCCGAKLYKGEKCICNEKYYCSPETINETLKKYGVAVVPSILNDSECDSMVNGLWDFHEELTNEWDIPINRNNEESWKEIYKLFPKHSMLQQHFNIGHSQVCWDVRQNPKVANVYSKLWDVPPDDLLVSFDGVSFAMPHEVTKRGHYRGNTWFHCDQSFTRNDRECVQSWVTGLDVDSDDATLAFYEGSHKFHKECRERFNIVDKNDWYKLNTDEEEFYKEKGCVARRISCPKGSIVLWDSRTIHCGVEPFKNRKNKKLRAIVYVCYQPRAMSIPKQIEKKIKAYTEQRTTSHWPCKIKLFPKNPQTYGVPLPLVNTNINTPTLTKFGKKLAGF